MKEKRKHPRIDSLNHSYVCVDQEGVVVNEGMGRTLNVSESGILLETHFSTVPNHFLTLTLALENKLVDITGKIVHSSAGEDGRFQAGIQFMDVGESALEVLREYIRIFLEENKESQLPPIS